MTDPQNTPNDFYCTTCGKFSPAAPVVIEPGNMLHFVCDHCGTKALVTLRYDMEVQL